MLNVLFILQELARPIKKEKIDLMAIYDPRTSPLYIRDDESKLNSNKENYIEWINNLSNLFIQNNIDLMFLFNF